METSSLLADVVVLLALSVPVVLFFRRLALPTSAGFLFTGALLGPHALGWILNEDQVEGLADLGVALLLFTVGLEYSVSRLSLMGRRMLLGGGGQMLATIALVALLAGLAGSSWRLALLFGFLAAMSSTAIALKEITDARQLEAPQGLLSIAILLFQDLAVIPLMLVVPLLGGEAAPGAPGVLLLAGKAALAVAVVLVAARYGFPFLAGLAVRLGGRELFVLLVVVAALGAALFTSALQLPLALGAFVAGLVISESEYSHQTVSEILPFRDVFNALFFLSLGMLLDAGAIAREPALVLGAAFVLVLAKGGILYAVGLRLSRSRRVALLVAASIFQVGEFSFVLAREALALEILPEREYRLFLAVAVLTMLLSPFVPPLARAWIARRGAGAPERAPPGGTDEQEPAVIVAGYGLNGRHLSRVLDAAGVPFRVIDIDPRCVSQAKREGIPIVFGDVNRPEALEHAGLRRARVLVVAISDPDATRRAVALARRMAPELCIIARARHLADTPELLAVGATQVVPEELETSLEIFGRVLRELHVPRSTIALEQELIRRQSYQLLRGEPREEEQLALVAELISASTADTLYVPEGWHAIGRSLGELELRKRTGASVISAARHGQALARPGPELRIEAGDVLVLLGSRAELDAARALLEGGEAPASPPPRGS